MKVEILIPKPLSDQLIGLNSKQKQLVLHSLLVSGVLPKAVIAKMQTHNMVSEGHTLKSGCEKSKQDTAQYSPSENK